MARALPHPWRRNPKQFTVNIRQQPGFLIWMAGFWRRRGAVKGALRAFSRCLVQRVP